MNLWHYLFGRRIRMWSPRSWQEVVDAINEGSGSPYSLIHHGVAGDVHNGTVRLFWSFPLFGNLLQPNFKGGLSQTPDGIDLKARYGAGFWTRLFFFLWYSFVALLAALVLMSMLRGDMREGDEVATLLIIVIPALLPLTLHFLFNWNADKHFAAIIDLLEREAGLQRVDF